MKTHERVHQWETIWTSLRTGTRRSRIRIKYSNRIVYRIGSGNIIIRLIPDWLLNWLQSSLGESMLKVEGKLLLHIFCWSFLVYEWELMSKIMQRTKHSDEIQVLFSVFKTSRLLKRTLYPISHNGVVSYFLKEVTINQLKWAKWFKG